MGIKANFEPLRELGFATLTNVYQTFGAPLAHPIRIIKFVNETDQGVYLSTDGTTDEIYIPGKFFGVYDLSANKTAKITLKYEFPVGTQFYIKYKTAPTTGDVFIECLY